MAQDLTKTDLTNLHSALSAEMLSNTKDVIRHFNQSQSVQTRHFAERFDGVDQRLEEVDTKLDALMEMVAVRKELHNLVTALRKQGIALEESEIFVA